MTAAGGITIRLAERGDVDAVLAISNAAAATSIANFALTAEPLAAWLTTYDETATRYPWFVATTGTAIVGFAKASPWSGRCAYEYAAEITVYVDPDHHRRGIGRLLYERLLPTLRAQGYHRVLAGIALPNPASVHLHEACGLRRIGTLERVGWKFGAWHDVGYWQGDLQTDVETPTPVRSVASVLSEMCRP